MRDTNSFSRNLIPVKRKMGRKENVGGTVCASKRVRRVVIRCVCTEGYIGSVHSVTNSRADFCEPFSRYKLYKILK